MRNTKNREFGTFGEAVAEKYMLDKGFTAVARNFYALHGETDVIVKNDAFIVFCEVKTRQNDDSSLRYGRPASAVGFAKRSALVKTAEEYLLENPCKLQPRIDVIEVYITPFYACGGEGWYRIDAVVHFENAVMSSTELKFSRKERHF